jgi:hypothetical protein
MAQNLFLDFLQAASNAAASNVSGPVDLLGMGARAMGVPVPQNAFLSSQWMAERGLTKQPRNALMNVAGETAGMVSPVALTAKAPQVANALLQAGRNAAAPATMSRGAIGAQRGALSMGAPDWADDFAGVGGKMNQDGTVTVYHRTTPEKAAEIQKTGVMRGMEDGLFFSSAPNGQIAGYGPALVELRIPASRLQIDDLFDSEAHFRLPTRRALEPVSVADWIKK